MQQHWQILNIPGTDTTATALEWCVLYLLKYPEEQEKIFSEVSRITVGNRRRVTLEDRPEAHYTNAFIDEVFRHCPEGTIPPPHKTLADVTFRGKFIPKDTQVHTTSKQVLCSSLVFSLPCR